MLTLDTSGLVALINPNDRYHREVLAIFKADRGPFFVPMQILAEIAHVLEARAGGKLLLDFLEDLRTGAFTPDYGEGDLRRIVDLINRYTDRHLGFADAAVISCAERHRGRVLTTDHRHFPVVAKGEGTLIVVPENAEIGN
jgi:predicted nucleic acid-binding protein